MTYNSSLIDPQGWNRYSYVGNHPLLYTDPSGLFWAYNPNGNNGRGEHKWFEGYDLTEEQKNEGWKWLGTGTKYIGVINGQNYVIQLNDKGTWSVLGYAGPEINFWSGPGTQFAGSVMIFMAENAALSLTGGYIGKGLAKLAESFERGKDAITIASNLLSIRAVYPAQLSKPRRNAILGATPMNSLLCKVANGCRGCDGMRERRLAVPAP